MKSYLAIQVRLHDGRYHGAGDWPPAPARLYQALIAGVGLSGPIPESAASAFQWLESLPAPEIIVPHHRTTTGYTNWVPNNDLDSQKGDPKLIGNIRTGKTIRSCHFDESQPLHYLWPLSDTGEARSKAAEIVEIADRLYQFGRGVDMAWAVGEILDESEVVDLKGRDGFSKFIPDSGSQGTTLKTPVIGSYQSLDTRYKAGGKRFTYTRSGRKVLTTFSQTPKPRFRLVSYNSSKTVHLFELRRDDADNSPHSAPLESIANLTSTIRDTAWEKLNNAMPEIVADLDRCLLGKNPDSSHSGTSRGRISILPLPSIGHQHADMLIRRVAVSISPNSPIPSVDLRWAFSNLKLTHGDAPVILMPASESAMFGHYQCEAKVWRTITPMALPETAGRRRIAPERKCQEAKGADEKAQEESKAVATVIQALRHAGYRETGATVTRIQRVPFQSHGRRVEDFSPGTRFAKERLWHVEIQFTEPIGGPLILGDGRFSGLGLFAPVNDR